MLLKDLFLEGHDAFDRQETLYHKDVGFPDDLVMPRGVGATMMLNYGDHARYEAMSDRYGQLRLPRQIDLRKCQIIEVGALGNVITKLVLRMPYDEKKDLVLVVSPATGFVKTVWANQKNDQHRTLDTSKYKQPMKGHRTSRLTY